MILEPEDKRQLLDRILKQRSFVKSPTSSVLLEYLVDATLKGNDVKETTIGVDLLGDKFDSERGNARIRVNIYNLRKKLENYYKTEGRDDPWRIVIQKGQYRVEFARNTNRKFRPSPVNRVGWVFVVMLLLSWVIFFLLGMGPRKPVFWKAFLTNGKPVTLIIGDSYGLMGMTETGKVGWFRDYDINSLDDLYAFLDRHSELKDRIWPANYVYTTGMSAYAAKEIASLFNVFDRDFLIRFTSNSTYSDIIEGNAIYVGPLKNNNKFIRFFNEGNSNFKLDNGRLIVSGEGTESDRVFNLKMEGLEFEYAIVCRLNGPGNTAQFIFFSDHDIGVKATVEYFTNPDSIRAFSERYFGGEDVPFTALFETNGIERTNIKLSPIVVSRLDE